MLKAALLRRATEDIHRIVQIRNSKGALSALLQRGSVGDDLWQRFLRAEKEIEEELRDVVNEVRLLTPWRYIFLYGEAAKMGTPMTGQCILSHLGPNYLPVRQRNRQ